MFSGHHFEQEQYARYGSLHPGADKQRKSALDNTNETELERALRRGPVLWGINNRDLKTSNSELAMITRLTGRITASIWTANIRL